MKRTIPNVIKTDWKTIIIVYGIAILLTFLLLKLPNGLKELGLLLFNFKIPFNWNHGIALLIATCIGYKFFKTKRETTFLGNDRIKSIIFGLVILVAYSIVGISNKHGINSHLWGLFFVAMTLIYDILEESFWRGYLNDLIKPKYRAIKYIITGILWSLWHVLIFDNFNQWGGFHVFLFLSIVVSFIIGFATSKTNSILVASSIHALLISKNLYVTLICLVIWVIMILTWRKNCLQQRCV